MNLAKWTSFAAIACVAAVSIFSFQNLDFAVPSAPTEFRVVRNINGSVTLTWNDTASNEGAYIVRYWKDGQTPADNLALAANSTSATFDFLEMNTNYRFRVHCYNRFGRSDFSPVLELFVARGYRAAPADTFVDSIGVNLHTNWRNTIWSNPESLERWLPKLQTLGVRYARDGVSPLISKPIIDRLYQAGVRFNFALNLKDSEGRLDPTQIASHVSFIETQIGVEKIIGIEGANEFNANRDRFPIGSSTPDWRTQVIEFQKELHSQVRSRTSMSKVPVLAPSVWRRIDADYAALGNMSAFADQANLHYYSGGRKPSLWGLDGVVRPLQEALDLAMITVPTSKGVWVTETGFNNTADNAETPFHVPRNPAAKYILRQLAELKLTNSHWAKTFIYEFLDNREYEYGLLDKEFNEKPAYHAVKNAITLLSDKGPAFKPGYLDFRLEGDLTDVKQLVYQKRDGRFYVLLWLDVSSYDWKTGTELSEKRRLTFDMTRQAFSKMNLYHPTAVGFTYPSNGSRPRKTFDDPGKLDIVVPDHVVVLELIP